MIVVEKKSLTETWLSATEKLLAVRGDAFSLIANIENPTDPVGPEALVRDCVDAFLVRSKMHDTQTVANTIFPVELANRRSGPELYETYAKRTYPMLKRLRENSRGTYFLRMIARNGEGPVRNQLGDTIGKIRRELAHRGVLRCAYELAVYDPAHDANVRMSFPCLSHISFKLDPRNRLLHLTAIYRNQFFIARALGNYIGLARLQHFVARETGLGVGTLVCHATHAEVGSTRKRSRQLIADCRAMLPVGGSDVA